MATFKILKNGQDFTNEDISIVNDIEKLLRDSLIELIKDNALFNDYQGEFTTQLNGDMITHTYISVDTSPVNVSAPLQLMTSKINEINLAQLSDKK